MFNIVFNSDKYQNGQKMSIDLCNYVFIISSTIYLNSKDQNKIRPDFFPCVLNFSAKKKKKKNYFQNVIALNIIVPLFP